MKQNKLVIAVLALIAVLFVLGLSFGVFREKDANDDELSIEKAKALKDRWIGSLEETMARFRDPLDLDRIKERPKCQIERGTYRLTGEQPACTIDIAAVDDAGVQEAAIVIKEGNARLTVPYPRSEDGVAESRGPRISIDKLKHSKPLANIAKPRPGLGQTVFTPKSVNLKVTYIPDGGKVQDADWEAVKEVKLLVLEKGGAIKFECENCTDDQTVTVVLK